MALFKETREAKYKEIDEAISRLLKEQPSIITREIAEKLGVSYWDITRSYTRLSITRANGRPRKGN